MIRKIAWETFKNTGDINAFMELRQIEKIEEGIIKNEEPTDKTFGTGRKSFKGKEEKQWQTQK